MILKNKVALIVGGTGSIGRATAIAFAKAGANVVIAGRNKEAGEEGVKLVQELGVKGKFIQADVTVTQSIARLIENTVKEFGHIDCAFNNAGWEGVAAKTADINEADWQKMLEIKLTGVWRCMKYELEQMKTQGYGTIVNTVHDSLLFLEYIQTLDLEPMSQL
jgi:NAD(P)-dependent dehydrogenase (short-subunit alcohol dehydrogenase family)